MRPLSPAHWPASSMRPRQHRPIPGPGVRHSPPSSLADSSNPFAKFAEFAEIAAGLLVRTTRARLAGQIGPLRALSITLEPSREIRVIREIRVWTLPVRISRILRITRDHHGGPHRGSFLAGSSVPGTPGGALVRSRTLPRNSRYSRNSPPGPRAAEFCEFCELRGTIPVSRIRAPGRPVPHPRNPHRTPLVPSGTIPRNSRYSRNSAPGPLEAHFREFCELRETSSEKGNRPSPARISSLEPSAKLALFAKMPLPTVGRGRCS